MSAADQFSTDAERMTIIAENCGATYHSRRSGEYVEFTATAFLRFCKALREHFPPPPVPDTAAKSTHPADVSKSSEEINTKAATPVAPPEAPSPELLRVHQAGTILSNIAFNLAQRPGEPLDADQVVMLDGARREWDAACAAFKSAREAYRMAQQTTTEGTV